MNKNMKTKKIGMFVILAIAIATAISGTTFMSLAAPAFAGGDDHGDHGGKKCKNNDDNNCNDKHKTQKIKAKNECEIENENKDHSKDNVNINGLDCSNLADNTSDSVFETILADGTDGAQPAQ
jgi:hypothetical protein